MVSLDEARDIPDSSPGDGAAHIDEDERKLRLRRSIRALPRRQKNVIILKHYEGLKIREISKVLGCSESSVKTHLARALQALRGKVEVQDEVP